MSAAADPTTAPLARDAYSELAEAIVAGQAEVMGSVAYKLANTVLGLRIDESGVAHIDGDGKEVVERLVGQYSMITGRLGVRMCHTSARRVLDAHPAVRIDAFESL